ncbi:uncharacterized protein LAESUDRAFT_762486 [Laetiporus sulphureus 93-53]|uniref:Uncharacterized protein n=1 Tax=Laetiporus sulphureus 93-53 TaxID=1314785 RepID=A0A165CHN0_9APHY|nr:uncharacterized protein LAESUDRAFT_762486 [Laetiporus sulphureus 93-53]KZT02832.1 hypothetical protein LAESUDRAFT_762486 [Laetiporus sulphureus 93-53]
MPRCAQPQPTIVYRAFSGAHCTFAWCHLDTDAPSSPSFFSAGTSEANPASLLSTDGEPTASHASARRKHPTQTQSKSDHWLGRTPRRYFPPASPIHICRAANQTRSRLLAATRPSRSAQRALLSSSPARPSPSPTHTAAYLASHKHPAGSLLTCKLTSAARVRQTRGGTRRRTFSEAVTSLSSHRLMLTWTWTSPGAASAAAPPVGFAVWSGRTDGQTDACVRACYCPNATEGPRSLARACQTKHPTTTTNKPDSRRAHTYGVYPYKRRFRATPLARATSSCSASDGELA